MRTKITKLNQVIVLMCLGVILVASEGAKAAARRENPKMRQTQRVSSVHDLAKLRVLENQFGMARKWADSLDRQSWRLLKYSTMSPLSRWSQNVDLFSMQKQYSNEMLAHLQAMSRIFRMRRETRGFAKLREFDFQNMIRKSDYLLALPMTRGSLEALLQDKSMGKKIQQTLALYNRERLNFDQKVFTIAGL